MWLFSRLINSSKPKTEKENQQLLQTSPLGEIGESRYNGWLGVRAFTHSKASCYKPWRTEFGLHLCCWDIWISRFSSYLIFLSSEGTFNGSRQRKGPHSPREWTGRVPVGGEEDISLPLAYTEHVYSSGIQQHPRWLPGLPGTLM